jgi:hypothetical protein
LVYWRALPIGDEREVSLKIWRLNHAFFSSLPVQITVADCDQHMAVFAEYLGFSRAAPLTDICARCMEVLIAALHQGPERLARPVWQQSSCIESNGYNDNTHTPPAVITRVKAYVSSRR